MAPVSDQSGVNFAAGSAAGAANVIVGFPFDTVKVHLQTVAAKHKGSWHVAADIFRAHGVRGFFRGASVPVIGGALECGVNYTVYAGVLSSLNPGEQQRPSIPQIALAAAAAGFALSFILGPVELIKCRLQLRQSYYQSPLQCVRLTVRDEGLRGLCRGLGATLAREVPGNAIFFSSYEVIKRCLHVERSVAVGAVPTDEARREWYSQVRDVAGTIVGGGLAGSIFWGLVLPIDTAKTRIQAALPGSRGDMGLIRHIQALAREGGVRGMWRGVFPAMVRAFPANAAQWLAWELVRAASSAPGKS